VAKRFYPAVLEHCAKKTLAVWFPDFPGCVAAGMSQEQALEKAEHELTKAVAVVVEREQPLPDPTPFERITIPRGCNLIALCVIGVEPPDPSERVNVYLPKSLITRADKRAAELGMSRSSFFGLAISSMMGTPVPKMGSVVIRPQLGLVHRSVPELRKRGASK
jgi:predicted RNase H-like HicB family nuclease